jgi:hypothetical protein
MVEIGDEATQLWLGPRGIKRLPVSMGCECDAVRNAAAMRAVQSSPIDAFLPPTWARSFKTDAVEPADMGSFGHPIPRDRQIRT